MDIYEHELSAYEREIHAIKDESERYARGEVKIDNLTHYGLAMSNRINLMAVGLCSLVEVFMYELAHDEDTKQMVKKLKDSKESGVSKFKNYLSETKRVNFGTLKGWDKFQRIYDLRNSIVHSYSGLVETCQLEKVKKVVKALNIEPSLVGGKRIRLSVEVITEFHAVIKEVVSGLRNYT